MVMQFFQSADSLQVGDAFRRVDFKRRCPAIVGHMSLSHRDPAQRRLVSTCSWRLRQEAIDPDPCPDTIEIDTM